MARRVRRITLVAAWIISVAGLCRWSTAADWPMLGRDHTRNAVSTETNSPTHWSIERREDGSVIDACRGLRWSAPLGFQTHSTPVISGGLLWVGTSNSSSSKGRFTSVLKCFRVSDGKQIYEYTSPQLEGRIHDAGWTGLGSSPLIEGDRLWIVTNRSEVLCLDIGPLLRKKGPPRELWKLDMIKEFGVFVHAPLMGPPRPCSIGPSWKGRIFVTTNNGVDESRTKVPAPDAPSLVCLNKDTGKVYWQDHSPGANVLLTQFSSPTVTEIKGSVQVIVPQGDGWVRAFEPETGKLLWEFDLNPKASSYSLGGRSTRISILANAVIYENRVYIASGLDVEQGEGPGRLVCIDPTKRGDISSELAVNADNKPLPRRRLAALNPQDGEKAVHNPNSGLDWEFTRCGNKFEDAMHRSMSSVAVAKGLVIAAEQSGLVHCLDAETGQRYWSHDTFATVWTSPLIIDDKIYVADENGDVSIYGLSADPKVALQNLNGRFEPLHEISMDQPIYASPIYLDGTLYLASRSELFAIANEQEPHAEGTGGFWPQWRGPNRDNVSTDQGLLKEWPPSGPPLLWRVTGLGDGISPVSIRGGRVFALSQYEDVEYIRALDERNGKHLWTAVLGSSLRLSPLMRWYTQRPPTVDGELLYAISLPGELACLRTADGREVWRKHYVKDFAGQPTVFGFTDCPIVDADQLICTPGGLEATIVALDKFTGAVRWKSAIPDAGKITFGNGVIATIADQRQFVVYLEKALVGVSLIDGRLLWRFDGAVDRTHTPLVRDGFVAGLNLQPGYRLLEVKKEARSFGVQELFAKPVGHLSRFQDDTVIQGDALYEPSSNGVFSKIDWKNGTPVWQKRLGSMFTITFADGHFYFHATDGRMSLIEASMGEPVIKSEFVLPDHRDALGTTTPIVTGGRLYVREDEQLFCYDVCAEKRFPPAVEASTITLPEPSAKLLNEHRERVLRSVFVPTPEDIVDKMLELTAVKQSELVCDLGSGDGRIVIAAAKKYGCKAVGYELDKELVAQSRTKVEAADIGMLVTINQLDLFDADLSGVDVLTLYLLPKQLEKLIPQLEKMKPGSRIVSHQFEIPGFPAEKTVTAVSSVDGVKHSIYLWTLPLQKKND